MPESFGALAWWGIPILIGTIATLFGIVRRGDVIRIEKLEKLMESLVDRYDAHLQETAEGYQRLATVESRTANGAVARHDAIVHRLVILEQEIVKMREKIHDHAGHLTRLVAREDR